MKARISNSLSARCTSACPLRHTCTREETHRERRAKNKHATFVRKGERFSSKAEENRKKVHNFSHTSRPSYFFTPFSFDKIMVIRKKTFIFALDKTQPSLLLAALRCLYSVNRRAFPDETTQTIFDLPKTMTLFRFSGLKPAHRFTKCATSVVSFHFHHIVRQVFQKKFVFLPQTEYTHPHP